MVNNMKNFRKLSLIIIAWFITMVQGIGMCDEVQEPTDNFYNITRKHNFEFDLTFAKKQDSGIPYIRVYEFKKINKLIPGGSNNN